jgi:cysteine desulfurase/selenocysteine lyase
MDVSKIRNDFPILAKAKPPIYFDNACMSLKPVQVIQAITEYYESYPACAGRSVHRLSDRVEQEIERARQTIAKLVGAKSKEIIFTRNTTEALNLFYHSFPFKKGDVILTTDKEHNSNLLPIQKMAKERGILYQIVPSKPDNIFDIEKFNSMMSKKVRVVSMVHTSNLDGVTNPVKEIAKIAKDYGSVVLLDGAQSVPHRPIDVKKLGIDGLAWSGHKMCGPTGTGCLWLASNILEDLNPFMLGGDTVSNSTYKSYQLLPPPARFEAGLQDYAGIIGFGAAAQYLQKIGLNTIEKYELQLNKMLTESISDIPGLSIIGPQDPALRSGILSFTIKGLDHHQIALLLDRMANIAVRSGQHCVHSWFNARGIKGSVRASLYFYNTNEEVKTFAETLKKIAGLK